MRLAILAAVAALGCGGSRPDAPSAPPPPVAAFPAARWVPAEPTYVLAAPTLADGQRGARDLLAWLGVAAGIDADAVSRELAQLLAFDPLSPEAVAALGVDVEGGVAVFSEALSPTFVVHLTAPDQAQAYFERLRARGLVTRSVVVDATEVFTAQLLADVALSWAISGDWLWVHVALAVDAGPRETWFQASHRPTGTAWVRDWQWAEAAAGEGATPGLVGFAAADDLLATVAARVPDVAACARLAAPVQRVAISVEADGQRGGGRLALDLGPAAAAVAQAVVPVPEGFAAAAAQAPLVAQWNLDLGAVRGWLAPCLRAGGADLRVLDQVGVRSGRAVLQAFDPDDKRGAGAILLELAHQRFFAGQLDDIPLRSTLERSRRFGPHAGHSLAIPFVATIDYVLTDKLALAAVGDGLLAAIVGSGAATPGPLAAIDVVPAGLSPEAWATLFDAAGLPADLLVKTLMRWREGHVALTLEGSSLVLGLHATRR